MSYVVIQLRDRLSRDMDHLTYKKILIFKMTLEIRPNRHLSVGMGPVEFVNENKNNGVNVLPLSQGKM